jgi:eukaryotic translation initiation factor 2-alpha kinase 4
VKKVRLKTEQNDNKIMREVNALSRLNHRFIVRYYTTWIETTDAPSSAASDDSSAESSEATASYADTTNHDQTDFDNSAFETTGYLGGSPHGPINGGFTVTTEDFDALDAAVSQSSSSFPSIHFENSQSPVNSDGSDMEDFDNLFVAGPLTRNKQQRRDEHFDDENFGKPKLNRTLYIQMV